MAKKKGKQKQEDASAPSNEKPYPPQTDPPQTEPVNWGMSTDNNPPNQPEPQTSTWGTEVQAWGTATENAGDSWGTGTHEQHDTWGQAETLDILQPPPTHPHSILPTIHEQPSHGQFDQSRQTLSDVGESQEEYSDYQQDTGSPQAWDHPQSQTLTATAAPSVMGSPAPPPVVSLAEAAAVAHKDLQKNQKVSTASEAARRLAESRAQLNKSQTTGMSAAASPAVRFEDLTAQAHPVQTKPMSVASAAAAAMESSMNKRKGSNQSNAQPSDPPLPGKTSWSYPKPFLPNGKMAARIESDPRWTTIGGNIWSRKHRHTQSASAPSNWSQSKEDAWNQQLNYLRQARQQAQQSHPHPVQQYPQPVQQHRQRPHHSQHHSHPGHPMQQQQQQRPQPPQNQSWQGWGKEGWDQNDDESEITEDEIVDGWGTDAHHGGNDWGTAWDQQPMNPGKAQSQGRGQGRKHEEQWRQGQTNAWGQGTQGSNHGWDQANTDWAQQQGGQSNGWGQANDEWGQGQPSQAQDNNAWGQGGDSWGQADSGWGGKEDADAGGKGASGWGGNGNTDAWGKGASDSGWGKSASETGWGKGTDTGAWGAGANDWGGGMTTSNGDWGTNANVTQHSKVTFASAEAAGTRNAVSPQQRSQILNSLLNLPQNQKPGNVDAAHKAAQQASATAAKKGQQKATVQHGNWGAATYEGQDNGWGSMEDEDDEEEDEDDNRRVHFSPKASDIWGGSPRSVPSKSLSQAHNGFQTTLINDASNVRFVESRGAAFDFASEAFFGNARLARDRIHWLFPADKDERVANMLSWVQKMSFNLGTYGLMKFLERKERGALFVNTIFRMHQHPREPAFDYLTFNQLQGTMDKTLQESVAFYDPARLVIVFVYLPSQTGNSVAIWRRKVHVPDNARLKYQGEVNAIVKTLRKAEEYVVMVDELPPKSKALPQKPGQLRKSAPVKVTSKAVRPNVQATSEKKKRKWWKLFLS